MIQKCEEATCRSLQLQLMMWLRVYSHLSCLVQLKRFVSPFGADLLGRCEYSNRTLVRTKQPNRDPAEEVVSVRFQTNSGTVR